MDLAKIAPKFEIKNKARSTSFSIDIYGFFCVVPTDQTKKIVLSFMLLFAIGKKIQTFIQLVLGGEIMLNHL